MWPFPMMTIYCSQGYPHYWSMEFYQLQPKYYNLLQFGRSSRQSISVNERGPVKLLQNYILKCGDPMKTYLRIMLYFIIQWTKHSI